MITCQTATRFLLVTISFAILPIEPCLSQNPSDLVLASPARGDSGPAIIAIDAKKDVVAEELRVAMLQVAENRQDSPAGNSASTAVVDETEVDLLKQLDVIIAQQKTATASLQDIQARKSQLETEYERLDSEQIDGGPPYSILLKDELTDAVAVGQAKLESSQASLLSVRDSVELAHKKVEEANRELRQFRDSGGADSDPKMRVLELNVQLANELLVLSRQQLSIEEAGEDAAVLETRIDERQLDIVATNVVFSRATLTEKLAEFDVRESELKQRSSLIQSELQYAERRWLDARQELDSVATPSQDLVYRVEALKRAQQTIQVEQTIVNQRLQRLPMMRTAWQRRYQIASSQSGRQDERLWLKETEEQIQQLAREKQAKLLKLLDTRETQSALSAKLDALENDAQSERRWLDASFESLSKQVEIYNTSMLSIDSAVRGLTRLMVEIEGTPSRTVDEWLSDAWLSTKRLWTYEITNIDDTSLTVGKIVSSLLFLIFGYLAAWIISSLLGNRLPKFGVDEAGAHAIESLAFYLLMVAFGLAALRYANVPLTVFTFLGGAIAIGVGFGSQNILNNFISGLILLAERPIRAGDLIMVDETYGNVKKIGARSTTIRTGENLDIIVPNSKFLENNVVNLTRRDDRLRTSINVGVAYGSNLNEVLRLLELAASENANVNERPKPFVWFNDFGDNSLAFQVHFWINARTIVQMRKIETDVRLAIDRLFRDHGISIAFPQRDLHLMADKPLELRLVGDDVMQSVGQS